MKTVRFSSVSLIPHFNTISLTVFCRQTDYQQKLEDLEVQKIDPAKSICQGIMRPKA